MNHGALAHLFPSGISVRPELLKPLSIEPQSIVTALYYPRPLDTHSGRLYPHDLMVTPIPFHLWPFVSRLKVRLPHVQGALAAVADWLARNGVNVLLAECSRSGHRYATWSMVVDIEPHEPDPTLDEAAFAAERATLLDRLKAALKHEMSNHLFRDDRAVPHPD